MTRILTILITCLALPAWTLPQALCVGATAARQWVESPRLPRINKARGEAVVTIFVGSGVMTPDVFEAQLRGVRIRIVDATEFTTFQELAEAVDRAALVSDVISFEGHGNPMTLFLTSRIQLNSGSFRSLNFRGRIVVLDGCSTGCSVWTEEHFPDNTPGRHMIGQPVNPERQLLQQAFMNGNMGAVIGNTNNKPNEVNVPLYLALVSQGGGHELSQGLSKIRVLQDSP